MSSDESRSNDPNLFKLPSTGLFKNALFTKFWLFTLVLCSGMKLFYENHRNRPLLVTDYSLADVDGVSIFSSIYLSFIANSLPELTICAMIIYLLRNIERRLGTRKYINTLFITLLISHGIHIILLKILAKTTKQDTIYFPYSPLTLIYISYMNYIYEIPIFLTTKILELIPACDHHFILFLLFQTLSQPTIFHFLIPSIISFLIYKLNLFYIQKLIIIPEFIGKIFNNGDNGIGYWVKSFESLGESKGRDLPIAATLERQRIEEEDEIQRMFYQRIAGRVGQPPSEALIRNLMDMGFNNRNEVIQALQRTGNNVELAANMLLQAR